MPVLAPPAIAEPPLPLVVTADQELLDDLLRLAGSSGAAVEVAADPAAARVRWAGAPLVVVGVDALDACARAALPHRARVVVVARDCAGGPVAEAAWRRAESVRAEHVVLLPDAEPWLADRLADPATDTGARGRVVVVLGGRGGCGASVLATGLAVTGLKQRRATLLVDADPLGGGVDLVLGWEERDGLRWPQLAEANGRVHPPALVAALPSQGSLAVLSFDRDSDGEVPAAAMAAALDAGRRGRDLVVVDVPRYLDEAARFALTAADRAYLLVPGDLRGCAAAAQVAARARPYCPQLSAVVRGPIPGRIGAAEVAEVLGLPLAGVARTEPQLTRALERGEAPAGTGRGPLAQLCRRLLAETFAS
ncbi:septum site-determining protein Ssd [Luedemannella helvata]|uniref:Septum formation initiator n=1 Tax=Luedemannella helvata TaxID=349315 RepID=A0ABP4WW49_9ACTN